MFSSYALAREAFLILLGIGTIVTSAAANTEAVQSRLDRAAYFAASSKNAAFPVRGADGHFALLLIDLKSEKLRKLGIKSSDLLSPYLSSDGMRLLFTRHPTDQKGSELIACDTESLMCKSILKSEGRISSPIEIGNGRILYVSSPYFVGTDGKGRYSRNDFWLFGEVGGPRKLTDMQLYQLSSIGVTNDAVFFSGYGPRRDNPAIPRDNPDAPRQSDVFKLPFDPIQGTIQGPSQMLLPLFVADGKTRSPAVSSDGSIIVFLRTLLGIGNYHYDLVLRNENSHTEILIPSGGLGFSRPVVVDHSVYANVIDISGYRIQVAAPNQQEMERLVSINDASIESTDLIELSITQ